ncbi:MAG: flagellar hook-basal body complex protein, partial [Planctomycetales bacterium]|nr:flagellar hook-basal body complex protein [Planctomycetales bacterium]
LAIEQDGFAPGTMNSVNTGPDGTIYGIATNGRQFPIAQLALASFRNVQGLRSVGDNYFEESLNTGDVQLGTALSGDRGAIVAGQLETSNVEVAQEFTRLIVAQRGFSANARTITVADKVLEELTNIIR